MATKKTPRKKSKVTTKVRRTTKEKATATEPPPQQQRDSRLPKVGSTLVRMYKGREIEVKVLETGFEYEGESYRSLSGLARHIVGYQISGPVFFKLSTSPDAEEAAS